MATTIRVTREFSFEMAHVLGDYDGPCRNIHGHSYKLFVTLIGVPTDDRANPKNGMVIDFVEMKKIINREIIAKFDHSVVLNQEYEKDKLGSLLRMFENINLVDYQPTCENLITDFAGKLAEKFPEGVKLHSLRLHETANMFAEWFADDNH
jgi:6-pyruvoyltetrahydropterin/6-carboxytetrahydropterin synthase